MSQIMRRKHLGFLATVCPKGKLWAHTWNLTDNERGQRHQMARLAHQQHAPQKNNDHTWRTQNYLTRNKSQNKAINQIGFISLSRFHPIQLFIPHSFIIVQNSIVTLIPYEPPDIVVMHRGKQVSQEPELVYVQ